jgi:sec-independent protein translocase protein TatB
MFGIGLSEIIIIAIIALLVVGPEKLPEMAAKIGRFAWDIRRAWDDVRDTVRTEMMTIKQPFDEIRKTGREAGDLVRRETQKVKDELRSIKSETEASLKEATQTKAEDKLADQAAATAEAISEPAPAGTPTAETAAEAAPEPVAAGPQPYRRKSPPPANIVYYDLDGNPVEPPPEKV